MGGASLGIHNAGFNIVKAYDIFSDALETHKLNLPNIQIENEDVMRLNIKDIPNVEYMHFSPPCQSFSTSGKRKGVEVLKGKLLYETLRMIKGKLPKAFSIENVKGLTTGKNKAILKTLIKELDEIGYNVVWKVLNAYNYDVVQNRERLFIVGVRKEIKKTISISN